LILEKGKNMRQLFMQMQKNAHYKLILKRTLLENERYQQIKLSFSVPAGGYAISVIEIK
jgi:hypothetical protein